jgi:hypothetical protein
MGIWDKGPVVNWWTNPRSYHDSYRADTTTGWSGATEGIASALPVQLDVVSGPAARVVPVAVQVGQVAPVALQVVVQVGTWRRRRAVNTAVDLPES